MNAQTAPASCENASLNNAVFSVSEAAKFLRLSEKMIRRKIDEGALVCSRIGKRVLITRSNIELLLDQCKQTGPRPKKTVRKKLKSA